jgi:hypothetical protein
LKKDIAFIFNGQYRILWHLKMKAVGSFETSGTVYPVTQRYIPEDQKLCHSETLKTHKNKECVTEVEKGQLYIKHRIQEAR